MENQTTENQPLSIKDFLTRAAVWAIKGYSSGLRGSALRNWSFIGAISEKAFGFSLEDLEAASEQKRREKERRERISNIKKNILVTNQQLPGIDIPEQIVFKVPTTQIPTYSKWREISGHPAIVLVLGGRGSGKSAVAHRITEDFRYRLSPYVVGFPEHSKGLLPGWMGIERRLEDVPSNSISVVDEAHLAHHSRDWHKSGNRDICRLLNLSRQQGKTIIFIVQQGRHLDIDIVSSADVLIIKNPGLLQAKFDRPEFRDILMDAKRAFQTVEGDLRRWSYVYSQSADFAGLIENGLPTFWSSKLSKVYANMGDMAPPKPAIQMTLEDKFLKAKELYQAGWSQGKLAKYFGVSKSTIFNWIHDYPYKGE